MTRYKVTYGDMHSLRQRVKMCYAFLTMDWGFQPEVTIVTEKTEYDKETVYAKAGAPDFKTFFKEYCRYRKGVHGIVGFDQTDEKKIGIVLVPEADNISAIREGKPLIFIMDHSDSNIEIVEEFFNALYTAYDNIED